MIRCPLYPVILTVVIFGIVFVVLFRSTPAQVAGSVIISVLVDMVNDRQLFRVWYKYLCYYSMQTNVLSFV